MINGKKQLLKLTALYIVPNYTQTSRRDKGLCCKYKSKL